MNRDIIKHFLLLIIVLIFVFDAVFLRYLGLGILSTAIYSFEGVMLIVAIYATIFGGVKFWIQWSSILSVAFIMLIRPVETQFYYTIFFFTYFTKEIFKTVYQNEYDKIKEIVWIAALITLFQALRVRLVPELSILETNPLDDIFGFWLICFGAMTLKWVLQTTNQVSEINQQLALKGKELSFTKSALALTTHHLKNPLSTASLAISSASLGKRSNGKIEIDQVIFDRIESAINRTAIMVNELVQNQNAIHRFQKDEINLNEIVNSTREQFKEKVQFQLSTSEIKLSSTQAFVLRLALTTHLSNSIEHGGDKIVLFTSKDQIVIKDNGAGLPRNYSESYGKQVLGSIANRGMGAYQTSILLESVGWRQELVVVQGFGIKIFPVKDENEKRVLAETKVSLSQQIY